MKRSRNTLIAVLAIVLTVGLGTLSTASASGLTTQAVRKIAAKVVQQKADKLEVKYADTAGDAKTVGGLTAGHLQSRAYVYTLPVQPNATRRDYKFPSLPKGQYLVTYSLSAQMTVPGSAIICSLYPNGLVPSYAGGYGGVYSVFSRASGSAVVNMVPSDGWFTCVASAGSFTVAANGGDNVSSIVFVPIDNALVEPAGTP